MFAKKESIPKSSKNLQLKIVNIRLPNMCLHLLTNTITYSSRNLYAFCLFLSKEIILFLVRVQVKSSAASSYVIISIARNVPRLYYCQYGMCKLTNAYADGSANTHIRTHTYTRRIFLHNAARDRSFNLVPLSTPPPPPPFFIKSSRYTPCGLTRKHRRI